jgi:hypothetical protein
MQGDPGVVGSGRTRQTGGVYTPSHVALEGRVPSAFGPCGCIVPGAPSVDCSGFLGRSLGVLGNQSSVCLWLFKIWQVAGALDDLESRALDKRGGLANQLD